MKAFKQILYMCLIPLMLVTKVIEYPITINFSPADFLLLIIGPLLLFDFVRDVQWRKSIMKNQLVRIFFLIVIIRALSSIASLFLDVERLSLMGVLVANLKFIMSFVYFIAGIKSIEILSKKRFFMVTYYSTYLFLMVGLLSAFIFKFEWAGIDRMVSLANDPNVAGMICLFGILVGSNLVETEKNKYNKALLIFSMIPFALGILLTGSRTALGAVSLLAICMLYMIRRTPKRLVVYITIVLIALNLSLLVETKLFESKNIDGFISRIYYSMDSANDYRNSLSRMATEMGNDYWLTGIGTGQFLVNSKHYLQEFDEKSNDIASVTHNTFLSFYAENGVLGFLAYALLLGYFLKVCKSGRSRIYVLLLIFYSLFFNIENIRFVWFLFGAYLYINEDESVPDFSISWKAVGSACFIFSVLAVVLMPTLFIPFKLSNQNFEVEVADELELYMEFRDSEVSTFNIKITGDVDKTSMIKTERGIYFERFNLPKGNYTIAFEPVDREVIINRMTILGERKCDVVRKSLWSDDVILKKNSQSTRLALIPLGQREYETEVFTEKDYIVYENSVKGVNYSDQIQLVSSNLDKVREGVFKQTLEFEKIGEIKVDYVLMLRGYSMTLSNNGVIPEMSFNYKFDHSLSSLEIGERFRATWQIETAGKPYMIYSGFTYLDPVTNQYIEPRPLYVYHGFVQ